MNETTGVISGTPATAGTYSVTVAAANAVGVTSQVLTFTFVESGRLAIQQPIPGPPLTQFAVTLTSAAGLRFELQASTNLTDWVPLATVTNVTGSLSYTNPVPNIRQRFYRAKLLP